MSRLQLHVWAGEGQRGRDQEGQTERYTKSETEETNSRPREEAEPSREALGVQAPGWVWVADEAEKGLGRSGVGGVWVGAKSGLGIYKQLCRGNGGG